MRQRVMVSSTGTLALSHELVASSSLSLRSKKLLLVLSRGALSDAKSDTHCSSSGYHERETPPLPRSFCARLYWNRKSRCASNLACSRKRIPLSRHTSGSAAYSFCTFDSTRSLCAMILSLNHMRDALSLFWDGT